MQVEIQEKDNEIKRLAEEINRIEVSAKLQKEAAVRETRNKTKDKWEGRLKRATLENDDLKEKIANYEETFVKERKKDAEVMRLVQDKIASLQ